MFAGGSLAGRLAGGALIDRVEVRAGAVGTSGGEAACFRRAEGLAPRDLTGSRALAGASGWTGRRAGARRTQWLLRLQLL